MKSLSRARLLATPWTAAYQASPSMGFSRQEYWCGLPLIELLVKLISRVRLFSTLWTVAHQAPPSMGFSRQEYWGGLLFPSPGYLPDPGIEPRSPALQADALTSEPPGKPIELLHIHKPRIAEDTDQGGLGVGSLSRLGRKNEFQTSLLALCMDVLFPCFLYLAFSLCLCL